MAHAPYQELLPGMISFMNPASTGHENAQARQDNLAAYLLRPGAQMKTVEHAADPLDMLLINQDQTLIYSDGGDGTVRGVIAAVAGISPDDPELTAINFAYHQELAKSVVYFAGAGGNANNWPLSALGRFAKHPEKLAKAKLLVGEHHPLIYEITDDRGNIIRSNIATSCLGLGASAIATRSLDLARPELEARSRARRLLGETAMVYEAAIQAPPFSVELITDSGDDYVTERRKDITALELIKSRIYAKQGRTRVNVDDTLWQPDVIDYAPGLVERNAQLVATLTRLRLARQVMSPQDFRGTELAIRLESDEPVPYQADGETDDTTFILPGQTMRLRLARIAIPTLIAA
jgi:hypothetical protein